MQVAGTGVKEAKTLLLKTNSYILALVFFALQHHVYSHEVDVHRRITEHAAASAVVFPLSKVSLEVIPVIALMKKWLFSLVDAVKEEDDIGKDEGGKRYYGHFYDPLAGIGLENIPPDDRFEVGD